MRKRRAGCVPRGDAGVPSLATRPVKTALFALSARLALLGSRS